MLLCLFSNGKIKAEIDEHLPISHAASRAASKGWNRGLSPDLLILKPAPTASPRSTFPQQTYAELHGAPEASCLSSPVSRVSLRLHAGTKGVVQPYTERPTGVASGQLGKLSLQAKK